MDKNIKNILRELECPVCNEYLYSVIPMCVRGHSICQKCKEKCLCCPVCKSDFGNLRNYTLEKLIAVMKYPCTNKKDGCWKVTNLIEFHKHMEDCELGHFPCPLKNSVNCQWKGKLLNLKYHLDTKHVHINLNYKNDISTNIAVISRLKLLFKVYRKYSADTGFIYWAVQYIGAKNKAKNYQFKVKFMGPTDSGYNLSLSADCTPTCDNEEAFDGKHIKVHIEMLDKIKSENGTYEHNLYIVPKAPK